MVERLTKRYEWNGHQNVCVDSKKHPQGVNDKTILKRLAAYEDLGTVGELAELVKAKQEREKGCEYCNTENNRYLTDDIYLAHKERHLTSNNGMEFRTINFCPMCGRPLKEVE